jgi:hypothetical protein
MCKENASPKTAHAVLLGATRSATHSLETVLAGEIAPRRGNVHDVGRTVTHKQEGASRVNH